MNYKVMQRPMFKMGGKAASQGTGITSGLDEKVNMTDGRVNYQSGPTTYQDFLDRAMTNYNLRQQKMGEMDDLINLQALGRVGNVLATEESNNPFDILQNIAMSGTDIALPALGAKKKLELKALDPTMDLAFAKALKPKSSASQKVFEMKFNKLDQLEKALGELELQKDSLDPKVYADQKRKINRRLKLTIGSSYQTEDELRADLRAEFIDIYNAPPSGSQLDKAVEDYKKSMGLAEGGRVDRAMGTPMFGEKPSAEEAVTQQQIDAMNVEKKDVAMETGGQGPAGQDAYAMLRARLPQEVPDDVVKLIAYNKQAFADFASIKNQEDVTSFNQKYNVSMNIDVSTV